MYTDYDDFKPYEKHDEDVPPYEQGKFPRRFYSFLIIGLLSVIFFIIL